MTEAEVNRIYPIAEWYVNLKNTTNDTFFSLFSVKSRYLVLKGGGGSGKSIFAGRKILERVTGEPGHRWLVCRKVAKTLRDSCFKQLIGQLGEHYHDCGYKVNKSDMVIAFNNGSEIIFAGLDDVEKLKSIYNITGIWIEEASEISEADFNQLDIRLRGETRFYKQIIITFNPVSILHWLKKRFFDTRDERARTHESTYKDNRFLDADAIKTLEAFRDTDGYYYQVYCLGQWGVTGRTVFDAAAVSARLGVVGGGECGAFEYEYDGISIKKAVFADDADGFIRLYRKPGARVPYVIGADTAGEGSDSFVAQVLDNRTGEQVATLRRTMDEDVFARQLYCLGEYYNNALIAVEVNFSSYPVKELSRLGYKNQYVREIEDTYTGKIRPAFGFATTSKTRPVIIGELIKAMREDISLVNDRTTLEEMLTFVRNEDFRPEAEEGAHDDCVMALAIAHYIRPRQDYTVPPPEYDREGWTADMLEDYNAASDAEKEYLIKKWGRPK